MYDVSSLSSNEICGFTELVMTAETSATRNSRVIMTLIFSKSFLFGVYGCGRRAWGLRDDKRKTQG